MNEVKNEILSSNLSYKDWMKFKREFENQQVKFANVEEEFKEASYQLKLAEMRLHRKTFEHLIKKSHHIMKDICGDDMDFDFCPNYTAKRINVEKDDYGLSYYNSGILLNKKNIETTKSVDFMAFWIIKAENWDEETVWWNCEIELSDFRPDSYIDNKGEKYEIYQEEFNMDMILEESDIINPKHIKHIINPNQNMWKKMYLDKKRKSITEEVDFRFIVRDDDDNEKFRGDVELKDVLQRLYNKYKSGEFDKYPYSVELSFEK